MSEELNNGKRRRRFLESSIEGSRVQIDSNIAKCSGEAEYKKQKPETNKDRRWRHVLMITSRTHIENQANDFRWSWDTARVESTLDLFQGFRECRLITLTGTRLWWVQLPQNQLWKESNFPEGKRLFNFLSRFVLSHLLFFSFSPLMKNILIKILIALFRLFRKFIFHYYLVRE